MHDLAIRLVEKEGFTSCQIHNASPSCSISYSSTTIYTTCKWYTSEFRNISKVKMSKTLGRSSHICNLDKDRIQDCNNVLFGRNNRIFVSGSQSQLVCSGCRNLLLYPVGATSVCCAVCNAVTAVPPPGIYHLPL